MKEDETVIITLKYKKNIFTTIFRDETEEEKTFGQLSYHHTETTLRNSETDPLVTYRIEFETSEKVTIVTVKGGKVFEIFFGVIGLIGGLSTSVIAATQLLVGFVTKPGFVAYMTNNLFLVSKYDQKYETI